MKDVVEISDYIVYFVFFLSSCFFGFVGKETETDVRTGRQTTTREGEEEEEIEEG